jgi:hypothetical protein
VNRDEARWRRARSSEGVIGGSSEGGSGGRGGMEAYQCGLESTDCMEDGLINRYKVWARKRKDALRFVSRVYCS